MTALVPAVSIVLINDEINNKNLFIFYLNVSIINDERTLGELFIRRFSKYQNQFNENEHCANQMYLLRK